MGYQLGDSVASSTLPLVDGGELTVDPAGAPATVVVPVARPETEPRGCTIKWRA